MRYAIALSGCRNDHLIAIIFIGPPPKRYSRSPKDIIHLLNLICPIFLPLIYFDSDFLDSVKDLRLLIRLIARNAVKDDASFTPHRRYPTITYHPYDRGGGEERGRY